MHKEDLSWGAKCSKFDGFYAYQPQLIIHITYKQKAEKRDGGILFFNIKNNIYMIIEDLYIFKEILKFLSVTI